MRALGAALSVLLASSPAVAHDYWLAPTTHALAEDGEVSVSVLVGERLVAEEDRPFEGVRTPRLELVHQGAGTDLAPLQVEAAVPAMRVPLVGPGGHLLVVDRVPAELELPAAKFEAYLRDEGLDHVIAERARRGESSRPGRERYRRNLKALFQVGAARDEAFGTAVDQAFELIPEVHPAFVAPGDVLPVRVLFRGRPLAGHRVEVLSRGAPGEGGVSVVGAARYTTDAEGRVRIAIDRRGDWLIRAVHMVRCGCADVDWESYWAAYTFGNAPRVAPRPRPPTASGGGAMFAVFGGFAGVGLGAGGLAAVRRRRRRP